MRQVSVAEAKAKLSELLHDVEKGETVEITRRGKPLAKIVPSEQPRQPIDIGRLRRLTAGKPIPERPFQEFLNEWKRDEERS
jgi:prevent-host-death family protein